MARLNVRRCEANRAFELIVIVWIQMSMLGLAFSVLSSPKRTGKVADSAQFLKNVSLDGSVPFPISSQSQRKSHLCLPVCDQSGVIVSLMLDLDRASGVSPRVRPAHFGDWRCAELRATAAENVALATTRCRLFVTSSTSDLSSVHCLFSFDHDPLSAEAILALRSRSLVAISPCDANAMCGCK